MSKAKHPMQPVIFDAHKVARFKSNAIVKYLLDLGRERGMADMNTLALIPFSTEDQTQFAQLIGYSVSGAGDLSYFDRKILAQADAEVERLCRRKKARKPRGLR